MIEKKLGDHEIIKSPKVCNRILYTSQFGNHCYGNMLSDSLVFGCKLGTVFIFLNPSFYGSRERKINSFSYLVLLAPSCNKYRFPFVGMSFAFLKTTIIEPAIIMGFVTFFMSFNWYNFRV